jgi:protein O-mannosyl-transferase
MPLQKMPQLRKISPALLLCALTTLMYWPGLSGGFIFDDYPVFAENPAAHLTGWHWEAWHALWIWSVVNIQRPLTMFSFALNYTFGGSEFSFKATNLGIHLLNTWLVLLLTRRLLDRCWVGDSPASSSLNYWACGIAIAWAIHPLQVSAVMYVVQRMELLGFTFTLLSLLAYWHARDCQIRGQRAWPWLLLSGILIAIGYGAKETVALVPGYTLLLELTVFRFKTQRPSFERVWKLCYSISVIMATIVFAAYLVPHYASPAYYVGRDFNAWQRELTQLRVLCQYFEWIVFPLPSQLHFYYDSYQASTGLLHPISTLLGGLALLGLFALAVAARHRRPLLTLGIAWFFIAHAITSSPLPLELVFEHRNYPALLGIALAVTDLVWLLTHRLRSRLPIVVALIFIVNLCFLTTLRAATWGNPLQLAVSLAQSDPSSVRAALDLARRYVALSGGDPSTPLYGLGIKELERASSLPSASVLPEEALLIQTSLHPSQSPDPTVWWTSLQHKLRTQAPNSENYRVLYNLTERRLSSNPDIDAQQLAKAYDEAIAVNPQRASLHVQYAELAAGALQNSALATLQWQAAVRLENARLPYVLELCIYLAEHHRVQEALGVLDEAQRLRPSLQNDPRITGLQTRLNDVEGAGGRQSAN